MRDDPKKVVDIAGRQWGEPIDGLALSLLLTPKQDDDQLATVSVAIHNRSQQARSLTTRGWLSFFRVTVLRPDGVAVAVSPYGRELMKPERQPAPSEVLLAPGHALEADIPIGSLYQMRRGPFQAQAQCDVPGGTLMSNEVAITL